MHEEIPALGRQIKLSKAK